MSKDLRGGMEASTSTVGGGKGFIEKVTLNWDPSWVDF